MFGAQFEPLSMPMAASCCAGRFVSSTVKAERNGMRSARPAARYCLTRFTPMPPGMKVKIASGCNEAILASSDWKSSVLRGVYDFSLVVALEPDERILAGLIVRRQQIDLFIAAVLRHLAENLMVLVVLVGG